jgi:Domain of unknown function (DUF3883)/EVE domain
MTHVKAGDIVFHYWQQPGQEPAIVAYSVVVGEAETSTITFRPHGKNSVHMKPEKSTAWKVPLGGMTDLPEPVSLADFRGKSEELLGVNEKLRSTHGSSTCFPFAWYKGELRAIQAYLTKFPAEIVALLTQLQIAGDVSKSDTKPKLKDTEPRTRTAGYISDPALRKAVELQAMKQADELLNELGYDTRDVSATEPYDIHATGSEDELAVEVKGSSGAATTVELTIGEVNKAREKTQGSMLVVVDQIPYERDGEQVVTKAGRLRFWLPWDNELSGDRLQPIRFRYLLPPGAESM